MTLTSDFTLQLHAPNIVGIGSTIRAHHDGVFIVGEDSWVEIGATAVDGVHRVVASGDLWPRVEQAWARWNAWGRPGPRRYALTARADGSHEVRVDGRPVTHDAVPGGEA
jgi:hypothetical protein